MSVDAHHIKAVGELSGVNTRIGWDASISSGEWWQYYTCSSPIIGREDDLSSTTRAGRLTALSGLFKDTLSDWLITRNRRKPGEVRFIEGFVHDGRITVFCFVPYCGMINGKSIKYISETTWKKGSVALTKKMDGMDVIYIYLYQQTCGENMIGNPNKNKKSNYLRID